jgi:hypothetical protein
MPTLGLLLKEADVPLAVFLNEAVEWHQTDIARPSSRIFLY